MASASTQLPLYAAKGRTNSSQNNKSPNNADAAHCTGIVTRQIGTVGYISFSEQARVGLGPHRSTIYKHLLNQSTVNVDINSRVHCGRYQS